MAPLVPEIHVSKLELSLEDDLGKKFPYNLALFSLSGVEGEVEMYRIYKEIRTETSPLLLLNFSLSESSRLSPGKLHREKTCLPGF